MPAAEPFERELVERELAESPRERAARRANQRWVTQQRLWAAMDREAISEPGDAGAVHLRVACGPTSGPRSWTATWSRSVSSPLRATHSIDQPGRATSSGRRWSG